MGERGLCQPQSWWSHGVSAGVEKGSGGREEAKTQTELARGLHGSLQRVHIVYYLHDSNRIRGGTT